MYCKYCGTESEPDGIFCGTCGGKLDLPVPVLSNQVRCCSYCGAEVRENAKFCKKCGNTYRVVVAPAPQVIAPPVPTAHKMPVYNSQVRYQPNQPYAPVQQVPPKTFGLPHPLLLGLIAAFIGVLGAFQPWVSVLGISVNGIDVDGFFTLVLSLVAIGVVAYGRNRVMATGPGAGLIILGILVMALSIYYIFNIKYNASQSEWGILVQVGSGLYMTAFAGVMLLISGGWALKH